MMYKLRYMMREAYIPFFTAHVAEFAQFYFLSTGLGWDKTGLTLYTAYAVLRLMAQVQNYYKQFYIWSINNISFIASEKNVFVTCSISVRDRNKT